MKKTTILITLILSLIIITGCSNLNGDKTLKDNQILVTRSNFEETKTYENTYNEDTHYQSTHKVKNVELQLVVTKSEKELQYANKFSLYDKKEVDGEYMYYFWSIKTETINQSLTDYTVLINESKKIKYNKNDKLVEITREKIADYQFYEIEYKTNYSKSIYNIDKYEYDDMELSDKILQDKFPNNYKIYINIKNYDNSNDAIPIVHNLYNLNSNKTEYIFVDQIEVRTKK